MNPPSSPCPLRRSRRVTPESRDIPTPSSPTSHLSTTSTRNRKNPSVTPRRFNRFFTPRSAQQTAQSARANRSALGDISSVGGNKRLAHSSPIKQSHLLVHGDENSFHHEFPDLSHATPEMPTPLKKVCRVHPRDLIAETIPLSSQEIPSSPPVCPDTPITYRAPPRPLRKSTFRKAYGSIIRREADWSASSHLDIQSGITSTNYQSETAHFYSTANDFHHTYNFDYPTDTSTFEPSTNPFCFRPCNTNSLAAIADEEGYVRLVETAKDQNPPLFKDYLHFRAHRNAILDLDFSEDDSLLATAAGDQTSQIVDMKTQKTLYTCWAHVSSLRQVKFQPGSGGRVLATSGRDGRILIWDTRCTPQERPSPAAPTVSLGGGITTLDPNSSRKYATWVHHFQPPIPKSAESHGVGRKADASVTALSFLSSSSPHNILSASATGPNVLLWDMRKMRLGSLSGQNALVGHASPSNTVKSTRGMLSIGLSSDKSRIYALSRDSSAYVYSTAQLLNEGSRVEALYGFRHKDMIATTWYHSLAVRPARAELGQTELLAVGGVGGRVLLFPTNEDYLRNQTVESSGSRNGVKIYEHGTVLGGGHGAEVSSVAWTSRGELCTASDDFKCRVWREDETEARDMRLAKGRNDGSKDLRWCGWADVAKDWDEEEV